ncbi:Ig-like domain-containing protein [Pyxidicoccus sp. 3LFB2]
MVDPDAAGPASCRPPVWVAGEAWKSASLSVLGPWWPGCAGACGVGNRDCTGTSNMNPIRVLVALCLFACAACFDLPEVVDPPKEPLPAPPLEVRLASPGDATHHTNGDVPVQVVVSGGEAEKVELLLGEEVLASLSPPYSYTWSTQGVPEGRYSLVARAWRKEEGFTSAARAVVVDRSPPRVVARLPAPGAQDVSVRAPIRIEFSEPLLASSVTEASFSVTAGGAVIGHSLAASHEAGVIEVKTNQPPVAPSEVEVTFVPDATDLAGNRLALPAGKWSWSVPAFLPLAPSLRARDGSTEAQAPALVAAPESNELFVAWNEVQAGRSEVHFRHWNGESWEVLEGLPHPSEPENRYSPQLILSRSGKLFTGFVAAFPGSKTGRVAEWTGSSWMEIGPSTYCSPDGLAAFAMAVDTQDNPYVAVDEFYPTGDPNQGEVYVCRFNGQEWKSVGTPRSLPGVESRAALGHLAMGPDGSPVVTWTQWDTVRARFSLYVERWDGAAWTRMGTQIDARDPVAVIGNVQVALARDGTAYVAWVESHHSKSGVLHVMRGTGVWNRLGEAIIPDASEGLRAITRVALQLDGNGFPVIAWAESGGSNGSSVFMRRWTGTAWTERFSVSATPSRKSALSPSLAFAAEGAPVIAHTESDGTSTSVYFQRFNQ